MKKLLKVILTVTLLIGIVFAGKSIYDKSMSQRDNDEAKMLSAMPVKTATAVPTATPTAEPTAAMMKPKLEPHCPLLFSI